MISLDVGRRRLGLFPAALLVVGLSACISQQPAPPDESRASEEAEATRQAPRPAAPRAPDVVRVTVPQGTQVHVAMATEVGSATSQVGDGFSATTTAPVLMGDRVVIPAGSSIHGHVADVSPATKGLKVSEKGGAIVLSFDKVTTPGGVSAPISASLSSVAKSGGKTAGIIGGSAAGGALLGKILGGETKDAAIGAVVGTGIGTGIAAGTKGKELVIPAGAHLALTLDQPMTIAVRS